MQGFNQELVYARWPLNHLAPTTSNVVVVFPAILQETIVFDLIHREPALPQPGLARHFRHHVHS
jgi:hypothetical protein